jgi:hypothetical protein
VDADIVRTLTLALTQQNSVEATVEIVRWLLDEICGEADEPVYSDEARRLFDQLAGDYRSESTLDAILRAAVASNVATKGPEGYSTALVRVEVV